MVNVARRDIQKGNGMTSKSRRFAEELRGGFDEPVGLAEEEEYILSSFSH
jgi:hypothetical protein